MQQIPPQFMLDMAQGLGSLAGTTGRDRSDGILFHSMILLCRWPHIKIGCHIVE